MGCVADIRIAVLVRFNHSEGGFHKDSILYITPDVL
jgi:hypothetical protein